jgi:hypothetical protein
VPLKKKIPAHKQVKIFSLFAIAGLQRSDAPVSAEHFPG